MFDVKHGSSAGHAKNPATNVVQVPASGDIYKDQYITNPFKLGAKKEIQGDIARTEVERAYQTGMANTAYQRAVKDMEAAGLNKALMFNSGSPASTPQVSKTQGGQGINIVPTIMASALAFLTKGVSMGARAAMGGTATAARVASSARGVKPSLPMRITAFSKQKRQYPLDLTDVWKEEAKTYINPYK